MPERLSLATVAACAALAAAVFGGAYALAHEGPAAPAPAPSSPTAIRLAHDPVGELHHASPLPALIVPPPPKSPKPKETTPVADDQQPVVPTPEAPPVTPAPAPAAPAPAPEPAPAPPPAKKPLTFDDSG